MLAILQNGEKQLSVENIVKAKINLNVRPSESNFTELYLVYFHKDFLPIH
jgi:hypothetical protein